MYLIGLDFKANGLEEEDIKNITEHLKIELPPGARGVKTTTEDLNEFLTNVMIMINAMPGLTLYISKKDKHKEDVKTVNEFI